jgi:hypothetical protein
MSDAIALNRIAPPGDQFTLVTLRVLDEEPDLAALLAWYRTHLHQLVVVNRLEGTPDFAFMASAPTEAETAKLVEGLASSEHGIDLAGRTADRVETEAGPFGADSVITASGYRLDDQRWLSVVVGTLDWRTAITAA